MRSTCSLYVDAGYLLAAAATRVAGTSLRSSVCAWVPGALAPSLIAEAEERSGLPMLRVHWYDSARTDYLSPQQVWIRGFRKVKLRLGRLGREGEQKGVDLRIGLDLVTHARNGAADVFFLVSGDDDLTEAVEEAQGHGVEVVALAVPDGDDKPHGVSRHLLRAANDWTCWPVPSSTRPSSASKCRRSRSPLQRRRPCPQWRPEPLPASGGSGLTRPTPTDVAAVARRRARTVWRRLWPTRAPQVRPPR